MITPARTAGIVALTIIVSAFTYLDRVYRELDRGWRGSVRERLVAFEALVEPRLRLEWQAW